MKQIRKRLTYANVMSSLAVFLVLGGATAVAASKIGANEIKANSIKTGKIVKEAVTAGKIKNGAIISGKLGSAAVTSTALADNSVTATKIANDAVTSAKIANDAVNGAKITNGAVSNAKLGNEAVNSGKLASGAVTAGKIGSSAVTEANLESPLRSRWARVTDGGGLVVGRNVVSSKLIGAGVYEVVFNSNVTQCGYVPARGTTDFEPTPSFIGARALAGNPNAVKVMTFDNTGAAIGRDFTLLVVC